MCFENSYYHCAAPGSTANLRSELIRNISDVPKSKLFVYFTKITAATWSINIIIPVSTALVLPLNMYTPAPQLFTVCNRFKPENANLPEAWEIAEFTCVCTLYRLPFHIYVYAGRKVGAYIYLANYHAVLC